MVAYFLSKKDAVTLNEIITIFRNFLLQKKKYYLYVVCVFTLHGCIVSSSFLIVLFGCKIVTRSSSLASAEYKISTSDGWNC